TNHAVDEPARPGWADGSPGDGLPGPHRESAKHKREMQQPVEAWRPHVTGGIEQPPARTAVVVQLEPSDRSASNQLHLGAGFVQQGGRLDGTLPAPDDRDRRPAKQPEVMVSPGVRGD